MEKETKKNLFSLTNRYIPAISVLAILAIINYFIGDYKLDLLNKHGEIINKSGKQRMFSQRALLLTHMYLNHNKKESLISLESILKDMEESNRFLTNIKLTKKLNELYEKENLKVDVNKFIKKLKFFISNPTVENGFDFAYVESLLKRLDLAVRLHEEHFNQDLAYIKKIEMIVLLGILFMLLSLVLFVFIPTNRKIEEVVENNIEKEKRLVDQSKSAQMGAMIGNIAHQWRQPLSLISTATTGMLLQKECGLLGDDEFKKNCTAINEQVQYLSKTIDTFTNYIKEKKEFKEVILQDRINSTIHIIETNLLNNHVKLINNVNELEDIKIKLVLGELSQVIINICNNAKDILSTQVKKDKWVRIDLKKTENRVQILIEDNGGGIPDDVMPSIFDPYFTTKHQSQGTGLGLHMSKEIIEKSLNGKLEAKNTNNGALFIIELPFSK
jgi:signal transduction histidine kinase